MSEAAWQAPPLTAALSPRRGSVNNLTAPCAFLSPREGAIDSSLGRKPGEPKAAPTVFSSSVKVAWVPRLACPAVSQMEDRRHGITAPVGAY